MYRRYGTSVIGGGVSKESLLILNPLRSRILESGFSDDDVLLGVKGSRELAIHDKQYNRNYYYDFAIKSLKVIVEYHGLFWHPREGTEYKGFLDYEHKKEYDTRKEEVAWECGWRVITLWSDEENDIDEILERVLNESSIRK